MIDVNKSLRLSKSKGAEEKLKLVNELKIITTLEDIYNLWSEVICSAAYGELYNPNTEAKFNEKENWKQESCMLVKRELYNIDSTLGLINGEGEVIHRNWKAFKAIHNITSASMNVLLERPGESYFGEAKHLKSKNKTCTQISLAAAEFVKVFLNHKKAFQLPNARAELRV